MRTETGAWAGSIPTTEPRLWIFASPVSGAEELARELKISRAVAALLIARGIGTSEAARRFLRPTRSELFSPMQLRDMDCGAARLLRAIRSGEPIEVHGDYDVDGTTSTIILKTAIEMAGGTCTFCIPHRLRDGYGMQVKAVESAAEKGVKLIVSVDTGIRALAIVERARELGMDVIITDHHPPGSELPRAVAVINPNRPDCTYPNKGLCGVGVAYKLVEALLSQLGWEEAKLERVLASFLKLVALGTVADVVPLLGENRAIVKLGLAGLRDVRNPGLRALLTVSGVQEGAIPSARQVGFQIGPRINAAGRMASADAVIELFFTRDLARATAIAQELHRLNSERQAEEAGITQQILQLCLDQPVDDTHFVLVFSGAGWHRGVLGIVASRIVERFHRPAIVLGEEEGEASGSGRSIPGFHLLNALEGMRELFVKYGGHSHAAGLTLRAAHVEVFRNRLNGHAAGCLTAADLRPKLEVDAVVSLAEMKGTFYEDMRALEPFGAGNRAPTFAALGLEVVGPLQFMKEKHIRVNLRSGAHTVVFKGFHFSERAKELAPGCRVDAAFVMEEDTFNGGWSAILKDVRASEIDIRPRS